MSDSTIARPTSRPTPLYFSPRRLVEFACFYAAEVAQGAYPYVDFDPDERWHQRIYRDPRIDVWLISWLPEPGHRTARPRRLVRRVHRAAAAR